MSELSLLDFEPARKPVSVGGKVAFSVRGLGVDDLTFLLEIYKDDVVSAASAYMNQKNTVFTPKGLQQMTLTLLTKFPRLTAEIISVAADARGKVGVEKASKLPFTSQATALSEILLMTFDDAGGLKNLLATLANLARQVLPENIVAALESRIPILKAD